MTHLMDQRQNFMATHCRDYLESGGRKGHIVNFSDLGAAGPGYTATLLLKTIGRKSGKPFIAPLIYGFYRGDYVIIASKGGWPSNPDWFFNLESGPDVTIQIATQFFRGPWRIAEGAERRKIWDYMLDIYPPFAKYQEQVERQIPVVLITPREEVDSL